MKVCLIQVPYMVGTEHHGGAKGPIRYMEAGADKMLAERGHDVRVVSIDRGIPFLDSLNASLAINKQLAVIVQEALARGEFPLVLGGACDVCLGAVGGFEHGKCGVVWFDCHGDFNTPETTITGFFGGLVLSVITGHCYTTLWSEIGDSTPIPEEATVMLGVRDLDPMEKVLMHNSAVRVVQWQDGKPQADVAAALDELARRVPEVYLHIDFDCMDPQVAPGIVDPWVSGGMSLQDVEDAIRGVAARFRIKAASMTTFNPERDQDDRTLKAGLRIMALISDSVSDGKQA